MRVETIGRATLYLGDCRDVLPTLGKIDAVVTSPPYDNLRTYNGSLDDWEPQKWQAIISLLFQAINSGGVVVWVVGDATIRGSETGTSFRQALFAMERGFNLHDTMIYEKQNPVPNHANRCQPCFEYMFVWSKGAPKTFNPIRVQSSGIVGGSRQRLVDGRSVAFHSGGAAHETKYKTNIWTYSVGEDRSGHPAVFPRALASDHIRTWSCSGDTILDPFMGSGTTGVAAVQMCRDFIGIEREPRYFDIACHRIEHAQKQGDLFIEQKRDGKTDRKTAQKPLDLGDVNLSVGKDG